MGLCSLTAEFGVCFIYVEILTNSALWFAHVKSSFQSPGNDLEVAQGHKQVHVFPGLLGRGCLSSSSLLEGFVLSPPPGLGEIGLWESRVCSRSLGI